MYNLTRSPGLVSSNIASLAALVSRQPIWGFDANSSVDQSLCMNSPLELQAPALNMLESVQISTVGFGSESGDVELASNPWGENHHFRTERDFLESTTVSSGILEPFLACKS